MLAAAGIGIGHYLTVGAILFTLGVLGIFINRKNVIVILMSIELILLAVNINFVAFSAELGDLAGQVFALLILTVAAFRRDPGVRPYGLALAGVGLVGSAWHNVIETFPDLDAGSCDPTNPCTIRWVEGLGFWTIPRMAFVAFALVFTALLIDRPLPEDP